MMMLRLSLSVFFLLIGLVYTSTSCTYFFLGQLQWSVAFRGWTFARYHYVFFSFVTYILTWSFSVLMNLCAPVYVCPDM